MWDDDNAFKVNPVGDFGRAVDRSMNATKDSISAKIRATDHAIRGRPMTSGEVAMVNAMFGPNPGFARARIFRHNFWWPYPNHRAMTPSGDIFFPGEDYEDDFSGFYVSVPRKALFLHEATHLYQWYVLKQWVIVRGPFDREYRYNLVQGQPLKDYGLEQMGQIVQDYYTIRHGGVVQGRRNSIEEYNDAVPVRVR